MFLSESTLDDLLHAALSKFTSVSEVIESTRTRGKYRELFGVLLELKNPRARLSRTETKGTAFSCLGELLWYLSGSNELDFIKYYIPEYENESDDGKTVFGAYGPRLLKMHGEINQIENVLRILRQRGKSRQAVIQLFDASDIVGVHKEIPCTCTLQFALRSGKLHMFVSMRSNDVFIGLPHDVFAFTMLQEIFANSLGAELGVYRHAVGSLHLYENSKKRAAQFVGEGFQSSIQMPMMPQVDPWTSIQAVLEAEKMIRRGGTVDIQSLQLADYWNDLIRLLQGFGLRRARMHEKINDLEMEMTTTVYKPYIEKLRLKPKSPN